MTDGITGSADVAWEVSQEGIIAGLQKEMKRIDDCLAQFLGGAGKAEGICERIKILNQMRLDNYNMMLKYSKDYLAEIEELRTKNTQLEVELEQSRANCNHLQQDWDKYHGDHQ